jgi:hypothetical protein
MGVGANATAANANAVVISTNAASIPILPSTDEVLTFGPGVWFTGITSSSNAVMYITPGEGV